MKNSDIIDRLLQTLINISGRKTTGGYAVSVMDSTINKLQSQYDFLKHIEIRDTRYVEDSNSISVMSDINSIPAENVGKALRDIISTVNQTLGRDAGHFFIREISSTLGDDYTSVMKDMGVDLGLMQLEHEVSELEKRISTIKKTRK